jgi:hypothetical protein
VLHSCAHQHMVQMGKKDQSPWLKREGWIAVVKTHPTTSPQYTCTLPSEGGTAVAQLHSSTDRPNGEQYQSPWLEGDGWNSMVKSHTTTSPQYTYTLPLEGGIAVAWLHSSTDRPNEEKYQSPWLEREGWSGVVQTHPTTSPQFTFILRLEGGIGVAQLHSSTDRPNGEKYQSPWLEGEGWNSMIKSHTTTSLQ